MSDLHVRPGGEDDPLIDAVRSRVEETDPDVFVIAGDTSSQIDILSQTLSKLKLHDASCLYVAGNHDIWFEKERGLGSLAKYSREIGRVCSENGFIHLPDGPHIEGETAFVGSIGWSDYSFRRPELGIPMSAYEAKEYRGAVWYDVFNVDWEFTDAEATSLFNKKLSYDLSVLPHTVDHVIYVSHHLPFQELTLYKNRLPWDFFSAYMGAKSTGELILNDGRVFMTISGHSHIRSCVTVGRITAITVPLGYGRPTDDKYEQLAHDAVAVIEVNGRNVKLTDFKYGDLSEGLPYTFSVR